MVKGKKKAKDSEAQQGAGQEANDRHHGQNRHDGRSGSVSGGNKSKKHG